MNKDQVQHMYKLNEAQYYPDASSAMLENRYLFTSSRGYHPLTISINEYRFLFNFFDRRNKWIKSFNEVQRNFLAENHHWLSSDLLPRMQFFYRRKIQKLCTNTVSIS